MVENFKYYLKDADIIFKYAVGPTEEKTKEFHCFNEIILFLGGDADFISENIHAKLLPNTLILIPKETYHQVIINGNIENYHRCIFQFPDMLDITIHRSDKIFMAEYDMDFVFMFEKLIKIAKNPSSNAKVQLRALLSLILCEISVKCTDNSTQNRQSDLIVSVIEYISKNLSKEISVHSIAKAANISPSSLAHIFKKEMNISIYQYILKKRLILAHHKITEGELASVAALECGFNDYSGFYKQYRKLFNQSPSKKENHHTEHNQTITKFNVS